MNLRMQILKGWMAAVGLLGISAVHAKDICTALADGQTGRVLMQEGQCDQRFTPASTFKIAISLMGFDSGFLVNEHSPVLPFKAGYPDWFESWKTPTDPQAWIKNSVVWYSQRVTENIGTPRFERYVRMFHYGNQDVSGNPGQHDGLTKSWLTSSLKISPLEQLAFLGQITRRQLPVSAHAYEMTNRITLLQQLPGGWEIHGKTGTGSHVNADGTIDGSRQVGWLVGWASKTGESRLFVHCVEVEAQPPPHHAGQQARDALMLKLPFLLGARYAR